MDAKHASSAEWIRGAGSRSFGSCEKQPSNTLTSAGGKPSGSFGDSRLSHTLREICWCGKPAHGGCPSSASTMQHPRAQMSDAGPMPPKVSGSNDSGDM